ncbi:MAG: formylmethanofuran dehydrogenase subunit C [Candidatus Heimdallarchaeota archaeon]
MAEITFKLKEGSKIPIEAEAICPDQLAGKTLKEIGNLPVWKGNKELKLSDLFEIKGEAGSDSTELVVRVVSETTKIKRIGQGMSAGKLIIEGNAGMHLAEEMQGGEVLVTGDVDDWAFTQMRGGTALVQGNAGHYLGAAEWGNWQGNTGGMITVEGNAGNEVGAWLAGGTIEIKGNVGEFLGVHMKKGVIVAHGKVNPRVGAEMTGGQIILFSEPDRLLSGFEKSDVMVESVEINGKPLSGPFIKFIGDFAERKKPKGVILIRKK